MKYEEKIWAYLRRYHVSAQIQNVVFNLQLTMCLLAVVFMMDIFTPTYKHKLILILTIISFAINHNILKNFINPIGDGTFLLLLNFFSGIIRH